MRADMDDLCSQGFTLLGVLTFCYLIVSQGWKLLHGFRIHIVSRWWKPNLKKYGDWAVVTGATDGIGKAYAEELARRGLNIVLISRTLEKLQKVSKEIEKQSGRKTKVIQVDFTKGSEIYKPIEEGLKGLDIGILVNNVGMATGSRIQFLSIPDLKQQLADIINCNITSVVQMTRIVLPKMVEKKKGLIINVSSEAGTRPYPMLTVYSATKVFVDYFSRGIHAEYKSKGITVQCVMPLMVSTNMTKRIKTNLLVKSADSYAKEALNTAELTIRTSGCLSHSIQCWGAWQVADCNKGRTYA
ncbi:very-long-chain 3-oxoacyl-CoA reductase isoform X2 [Bombina bombina]|uniref:very-long-chain 3-oxoacyl-CoA reductase isoform X2 n=1 Tax=Bombina bombina TaxID=8345 RepID=UPI00235B263B|nr:very-long-chain 3-oxoacyl-CoA reductase isoform X2 [Bombina bombina]